MNFCGPQPSETGLRYRHRGREANPRPDSSYTLSSTSKRLGIVIYGAYPRGTVAARDVQTLAAGFRAHGYETDVFCAGGKPETGEWPIDETGTRYCTLLPEKQEGFLARQRNRIFEEPREIAESLLRFHRERPFQAIMFYHDVSYVFRPAFRLLAQHSIRILLRVTEWHRLRPRLLGKWHFWDQLLWRGRLMRLADGLVGVSDFWLRPELRGKGLACVVPPMLNPGFAARLDQRRAVSAAKPAANGFSLFYTGILSGRELPGIMFEACRLAARKIPGLRLNVFGANKLRPDAARLRRQAEQDAELKTIVQWHGRVPEETYLNALQEANACILLRDGTRESLASYPTRIAEFLYAGKPLITGDSADARNWFEHRKSALVVSEQASPGEVAAELEWLATHPAESGGIGEAARATAAGKLSPAEGIKPAISMLEQWQ